MSLDFAIKDIVRNRHVSMPFIIAIAVSTSISVIGADLTNLLSGSYFGSGSFLFSSGFNLVFEQFSTLSLVLLLILPAGVSIFSLHAWIAHKKKDIATMKAIGTLPAKLYSFFSQEILAISCIGYVLGLIGGSSVFLVIYLILDGVGMSFPFQVEFWWNIGIFAVLIGTTFFAGGAHLRKIGGTFTVAQTLAGDIPISIYAGNRGSGIQKRASSKFSSIKIAMRNIKRRRYDFQRTLAILSICGTITFITILGSVSLTTSMTGYMASTIDENTIAIGYDTILPFIDDLYAQFSDPSQTVSSSDVNFSQPEYFFSASKISAFLAIDGVLNVDPRVCLLAPFKENIVFDIANGSYVGKNRSGVAVIMGLNSTLAQGNFFQQGTFVGPDDMENITIGDTIAYEYLENYEVQTIEIQGHDFNIIGMVLDTLYNGQSIYMGIQNLWTRWPESAGSYNLILLQVDSSRYEEILSQLPSLVQTELGSNFGVLGLRSTIRQNQAALYSVDLYFIGMALAVIAVSCFALNQYQKGASTLKTKDLRIMRTLGARRTFLIKTLYWENNLLTFPSLGLAMAISMIFVETFLVAKPELLPSLWVPLAIFGFLIVIFSIANLFIAMQLFKRARGLPDDLDR